MLESRLVVKPRGSDLSFQILIQQADTSIAQILREATQSEGDAEEGVSFAEAPLRFGRGQIEVDVRCIDETD